MGNAPVRNFAFPRESGDSELSEDWAYVYSKRADRGEGAQFWLDRQSQVRPRGAKHSRKAR